MTRALLALLVCFSVAGCGNGEPASVPAPGPVVAPADTETARLNEWLDAAFEEELEFSPIRKTTLGRKDDYDRIDDASEASLDVQLIWRRAKAEVLELMFDYEALTPEGKTSYDVWLHAAEQAQAAAPFRRREYIFHQMRGPHTTLPQLLINFHRVDDADDMRAYVRRIGGIGYAIGQYVERARLAAAEGVHAPRFAYEGVLQQSRALVTGAPFDGPGDAPLWADAKSKIDALAAAGKIDATAAEQLRETARTVLVYGFKPAYDGLIAWVESELPKTDETATGVWKLPDGPAFYAERLAAMTTTELTADEIHELGLREVERIHAEMEAIKRSVGFEGSLQEFFAFVRSDPRFYFANDDAGREAYLEEARAHLAAIETRLPQFFGLLPKAKLTVKRVEAFREIAGGAQHYNRGTPDGSRPGTYYVHLIDMSANPKPMLESIAYHEGVPGHHLQISIAQELTGLPVFRTQAGYTAYSEGWGLYSEALAKEMGGYQDPYSDFGRLTAEIWRAIRLVTDTGLHAKGWTEEQAVAYAAASSALAESQIRAEIRRYIVMPGQATSYKIGMLKIQELRAKAEMELGDRFSLRGFHDAVLGGGALPLALLQRRVDEWIAESKP